MSLKAPRNILITLNQVIWRVAIKEPDFQPSPWKGLDFALLTKSVKFQNSYLSSWSNFWLKRKEAGRKRMTSTDSTWEILNVFRANDSSPFPLNLAIMNITNVSLSSFFSISSPFLGYFHPSIFTSFLVIRYGFEYISAKLHKWPIWLSLRESDSENCLEVSIVTSPQDVVLVPLMSTLVCWRSKIPFCIAGPTRFASS